MTALNEVSVSIMIGNDLMDADSALCEIKEGEALLI